jgi:hypothetical protein
MRMPGKILTALFLASAFLFPAFAGAQVANFKEIDAKVREFRSVLDQAGVNGTRFWTRLDSSKRPHRLFVGEAFMNAGDDAKENFIEVFSRFLAGHPDKNMLIDIYDANTSKLIGEYGFGGFRLFPPK